VLIALGLKAVAYLDLATVTLCMGFAGDPCETVDTLRVHVILSLCTALII